MSAKPKKKPLEGKIAVVAGSTRGAGRGIAAMLGEAGATVYCTGRSVRGTPPAEGVYAGRKETIEETADIVSARGGRGIAVRVDHSIESEVAALAARVEKESGSLDILVNDISEGVVYDFQPFWKTSIENGFRAVRQGVFTHLVTCRHLVPLMIEKKRTGPGLVVEIGDGDTLAYRQHVFYDLVKTAVSRLAFTFATELRKHRVAAVAVTPGYMRTEYALDHLGVTEANWRDAGKRDAMFLASETPMFVGRAVAALAADPNVMEKSGGLFASWTLSDEYGFTDVDGSRPHFGRHMSEGAPAAPPTRVKGPFTWTIDAASTTPAPTKEKSRS